MNPFSCVSLEPKAEHNQTVAQLAFESLFIVFLFLLLTNKPQSAEIKTALYIKNFFLLQQTQ